MKYFVFLLMMFALPLGALAQGGTNAQSDIDRLNAGFTPSHPLYFLDTFQESASLFLTFNEETRIQRSLEYAEERLAEAMQEADNYGMDEVERTEHIREALNRYEDLVSYAQTHQEIVQQNAIQEVAAFIQNGGSAEEVYDLELQLTQEVNNLVTEQIGTQQVIIEEFISHQVPVEMQEQVQTIQESNTELVTETLAAIESDAERALREDELFAHSQEVREVILTSEAIDEGGLSPSDALYFLDTLQESVVLLLTFDEEREIQISLEYAEERLAEAMEEANKYGMDEIERAEHTRKALERYEELVARAEGLQAEVHAEATEEVAELIQNGASAEEVYAVEMSLTSAIDGHLTEQITKQQVIIEELLSHQVPEAVQEQVQAIQESNTELVTEILAAIESEIEREQREEELEEHGEDVRDMLLASETQEEEAEEVIEERYYPPVSGECAVWHENNINVPNQYGTTSWGMVENCDSADSICGVLRNADFESCLSCSNNLCTRSEIQENEEVPEVAHREEIGECMIWYGNNVAVPNQYGNTPWGGVESCDIASSDCGALLNTGSIQSCNSCSNNLCVITDDEEENVDELSNYEQEEMTTTTVENDSDSNQSLSAETLSDDAGLTPSDALYFLDTLQESVVLLLTFDEEREIQIVMEYAEERLAEAIQEADNYGMDETERTAHIREALERYEDLVARAEALQAQVHAEAVEEVAELINNNAPAEEISAVEMNLMNAIELLTEQITTQQVIIDELLANQVPEAVQEQVQAIQENNTEIIAEIIAVIESEAEIAEIEEALEEHSEEVRDLLTEDTYATAIGECAVWYGNNVVVPNQYGSTPWGMVDSCDSAISVCGVQFNSGFESCLSCSNNLCVLAEEEEEEVAEVAHREEIGECMIWYGNNVTVPNQYGTTPWGGVESCDIAISDCGALLQNQTIQSCSSCSNSLCIITEDEEEDVDELSNYEQELLEEHEQIEADILEELDDTEEDSTEGLEGLELNRALRREQVHAGTLDPQEAARLNREEQEAENQRLLNELPTEDDTSQND